MTLELRTRPVDGSSTSMYSGAVTFRACNFDNATASSSGCTVLLGGSSFRVSQSCGGEGGGEMKNSLSGFGAARCCDVGERLV